jgi:hypothetical protein
LKEYSLARGQLSQARLQPAQVMALFIRTPKVLTS